MKYYSTKFNDKGTIAVDDSILVKGELSTSGSHILESYKPLFSAEAVERLVNKGFEISGKTNVGEFTLDLVGEFSYYNELQENETLKGAAAELVKSGEVKAALGVDMNGATRRAAALSSVSFLKPTYGTVSRYGVISCAASGEQLGVYAKDCDTVAEIMSVIAGHDDKDGTSLSDAECTSWKNDTASPKKVALLKGMIDGVDADVKAKIDALIEVLKKMYEEGVITSKQYKAAIKKKIKVNKLQEIVDTFKQI